MSHQIPDEPPPTLHSPSPLEVAVGDTAYTVRRGKKWWKLAHPDQIINLCYCTKPPEYTLAAGLTGKQAREVALRAEELAAHGLSTTVADARYAKPIDTALIEQLARHHEVLVTIEEGSTGGFSALVLHHLARSGLLDHGLKIRPMVFPDRFIDHNSPAAQMIEAGLTTRDIVATVLGALARQQPRMVPAP